MKSLKFVLSAAALAVSVLGTGAVSAHGHGWGHGHHWRDDRWRDDDDYYQDEVRVVRPPVEVFTYARVVDVDPIVSRVTTYAPQSECWSEDRVVYPRRGIDSETATPTIVGAIVGGVIGHQFGRGHSRDLGTVAGAVLGGAIGHDAAVRRGGSEVRSVQRCATRDYPQYDERVDGYRVRYVYRGYEYTTVMPYDPGDRVRLRVGATVVVVP